MSGSDFLPMNFRLSFDERIRALVVGVPSWIRRKREIEDRLELAVRTLRDMRAAGVPSARVTETADAAVAKINELIDAHNRYYPIEANLPVDVKTGRLMERGGAEPWTPLSPVTTAQLFAGG